MVIFVKLLVQTRYLEHLFILFSLSLKKSGITLKRKPTLFSPRYRRERALGKPQEASESLRGEAPGRGSQGTLLVGTRLIIRLNLNDMPASVHLSNFSVIFRNKI